jgi:acyl carrier protein
MDRWMTKGCDMTAGNSASDKVFALVKGAIEELNEELEYDSLRDVTAGTPVYGGDDGIDSFSLVTLIVGLEQQVEQAFGKTVPLADEKAMSMRNSPYRTAGTLIELILTRLGDRA